MFSYKIDFYTKNIFTTKSSIVKYRKYIQKVLIQQCALNYAKKMLKYTLKKTSYHNYEVKIKYFFIFIYITLKVYLYSR